MHLEIVVKNFEMLKVGSILLGLDHVKSQLRLKDFYEKYLRK